MQEGYLVAENIFFCNSEQWMDLNNNCFLYIVAHLITLPGFLITSPRSLPAVLSQLQKIHHRVKSKWLRIGFPRSLRGQCVHRRFTKVLLMTWWSRTRRWMWCWQLRIWRYLIDTIYFCVHFPFLFISRQFPSLAEESGKAWLVHLGKPERSQNSNPAHLWRLCSPGGDLGYVYFNASITGS